jgi:acyl dehydratase
MTLTLASLQKGYTFTSRAFDLSPDWARDYARAVEDEATAQHVGPDFLPPMAVAALSIRALLEEAALPPGTLHAGQELAFIRPVRVGERLEAGAVVAGRGERHGWVLMSVDLRVQDAGGHPVMDGRATISFPIDPESTGGS